MKDDIKVQAKARNMHESRGLPLRDIAAKLKRAPNTIANWCKRGLPDPENGQWKKGKYAEKLVQIEQKSTEDYAANAGLTKALVAEGIVKLIHAKSFIREGKKGALLTYAKPDYAKEKTQENGTETATILGRDFELVPDRSANADGLKMAIDVLAMKKPTETENKMVAIMDWVRKGKK